MELLYLVQIIRRHRRLIAWSACLGSLLALTATYVLAEKFEATTSILIRPRRSPATEQAGKSMMDYPVSFNIPVDSMSKTYTEVMGSEAIAVRVVDALHLDTLKPPRDPRWWKRQVQVGRDYAKLAIVRGWEFLRYGRIEPKDPYREAVENVQKAIQAVPVTDTFLFSLKVKNSDPELAARIANTAAEAFIAYTRLVRSGEESTGVRDIRSRLDIIREELDQARTEMQAFGEGTTAASLDHELQLHLDELAKFEASRAIIGQQLTGLNAEAATLRQQVAAQSDSVRISTTVARNPVVTETETALARYQVEYAGLISSLQLDHPRMRELRGQIEEAQRRLAAASAQVPDRDTSALNQTREQINQRLLDRMAQRDAAAAQVQVLDQTIQRYRDDVKSLTAQKSGLSRLVLNMEVRENEYRLLSQEEAQANLTAMQQLGEIRQLNSASAPTYPVGPIKIYYAAVGFSLGLIFSLCAVLLIDYADPRVHSVDDVNGRLGMRLLAVVPHGDASALSAPMAPADVQGLGLYDHQRGPRG